MIFGDAFFDDYGNEGKKSSKSQEEKAYEARYCEDKWYLEPVVCCTSEDPGSIHDMAFMTKKHRAALFYYQGNYLESASLYEDLLGLVPKGNACVTRELKDGLARSLVKIGKAKAAKKEVEQLVAPPRNNDWSAWKLLAQCHKQLQDTEARVFALQQSVLLQRSHANFWIELAKAYDDLRQQWCCKQWARPDTARTSSISEEADSPSTTATSCSEGVIFVAADVLSRTVQLFRPYLSWRSGEEFIASAELDGSTLGKSDTNIAAHSHLEPDTDHGELVTPNEAHQHYPTDFPVEELRPCTNDLCKCTELCPLYRIPLSREDGESSQSYMSAMMAAVRNKEVQDGHSLQETSKMANFTSPPPLLPWLCFDHSIFVVLVSGLVSSEDVVKEFEHLSCLLDHFCFMSTCSCLMWARQLLLYSARYSISFPKDSVELQLQEVEAQLDNCPNHIVNYIKLHFTKRTVFDEVD